MAIGKIIVTRVSFTISEFSVGSWLNITVINVTLTSLQTHTLKKNLPKTRVLKINLVLY